MLKVWLRDFNLETIWMATKFYLGFWSFKKLAQMDVTALCILRTIIIACCFYRAERMRGKLSGSCTLTNEILQKNSPS